MLDIVGIRLEISEIKKMLSELYDKSVILELMIEMVVPTVHVPNIQAISNLAVETREETQEKIKEKKRKKHEEKEAAKKAWVDNIQDEQDRETRVREMTAETSCSINPFMMLRGTVLCP